jgi:hypothetical protein
MSESTRCFRSWRFNRWTGRIEGIHELSPQCCPHVHCRLVEDQGRLLRLEEYRADRTEPFIKVFGYSGDGDDRILEALDYDPDGSLRLVHQYVYHDGGPMIDRIELAADGSPRGHVTSRWDDGIEVEETAYDTREVIRNRHCYQYDEVGNLVRESVLDRDGRLEGIREMEYDVRGNLVEKRWYSADGTLQSRFVHAFRADDLVALTTLYDGNGAVLGQRRFEYDEVGNITYEGA